MPVVLFMKGSCLHVLQTSLMASMVRRRSHRYRIQSPCELRFGRKPFYTGSARTSRLYHQIRTSQTQFMSHSRCRTTALVADRVLFYRRFSNRSHAGLHSSCMRSRPVIGKSQVRRQVILPIASVGDFTAFEIATPIQAAIALFSRWAC